VQNYTINRSSGGCELACASGLVAVGAECFRSIVATTEMTLVVSDNMTVSDLLREIELGLSAQCNISLANVRVEIAELPLKARRRLMQATSEKQYAVTITLFFSADKSDTDVSRLQNTLSSLNSAALNAGMQHVRVASMKEVEVRVVPVTPDAPEPTPTPSAMPGPTPGPPARRIEAALPPGVDVALIAGVAVGVGAAAMVAVGCAIHFTRAR